MPSPKGAKHHRVNQDAYVRVVKALLQEPQTASSIEEITGLHRITVQRLFRTFKKHDVVHIVDWEPDSRGRDAFGVYALGKGRDKPKFRMSRQEISRRYKEKQKRKKSVEVLDNIIKGVKNEKRADSEACAV